MRAIVSAVLLAAWLGAALITAAAVAPAAFAVLPTRALAGALVGRVLPPLFVAGIAVGAGVAVAAFTGPSPYRGARVVLAAAVAAACAAAQFGIAPRIERVRAAIGPSVEALDPADPRRVEFGRLHGLSVAMLGVAALAGGATLVLTALAARPRG